MIKYIPEIEYWKNRQIKDLDDIISLRIKSVYENNLYIVILFDNFQWISFNVKNFDFSLEPCVYEDFDDFLKEEGILEEVEAKAIKRVVAFQIEEMMKEKKKKELKK